jgi:precorrin-3B synthase
MTALQRRGACPGLSAPMPTGDGLLVRLMPTEPVPIDAFIGFCQAAKRHGNGTIEVSARGSLQVRGLTPRSAPLFASAVAALEIAADEGISVIAGPDPAIHREQTSVAKRMDTRVEPAYDDSVQTKNAPIDIAGVAADLRRMLGNAGLALTPKVSVVVDGNGGLHLDAISADVRLRANDSVQARPCLHVGLGGDSTSAIWLGSIAPHDAADVVVRLLLVIAAHGLTARAVDILHAEGVGTFLSVLDDCIVPSSAPSRRPPAEMIGIHPVHDGTYALGIGLAFGHAHADTIADIARIAAAHGAHSVRPAPDRALLLIGVVASDATNLTAAATRLGFVVHPDDPRRRIVACPGAPACASGLIPARALAAALAPTLATHLPPGRDASVHISGCLKGCAHPRPAALTLVGTAHGCGIVHDGDARATPECVVDPANLVAEISAIAAQTREAVHG